tara:strand:- start:149 stop:685 length:537 start_codon:yes stop_codon:yes gene_type:complete
VFPDILTKIADHLDRVLDQLGQSISWLNLLMAIIVLVIVVLRYWLSIGSVALQESITYLHAALFMLGISYTLQHNGHVRVDIFYRNFSARRRALVNLAGLIMFLIPTCVLIIVSSWDYVNASWATGERSEESSGIAFVYGLKTLMIIMPSLLIVQGIAGGLRHGLELKLKHPNAEDNE